MTRFFFVLAVIVFLVGAATSQDHAGGVNVGGGYPFTGSSTYLTGSFSIDRTTGVMTSIGGFSNVQAMNPYHWNHAQNGLGNNTYVYASNSTSRPFLTKSGVYEYDPNTLSTTTIVHDTMEFNVNYSVNADQDGNWLVTSFGTTNNRSSARLYKADGSGNWTTVVTSASFPHAPPATFVYPGHKDYATGAYLLHTNGNFITTVSPIWHPVYAVEADGTVSTYHASVFGPRPNYGANQMIATGENLFCDGGSILSYRPGSNPVTMVGRIRSPLQRNPAGYGSVIQNQSMKNPHLIVYTRSTTSTLTSASLTFFDPQASYAITKTVSFINATTAVPIPYDQRHIFNDRDRYIQTVKTQPGRWSMNFNLPAHANKRYAVGAGFTGITPGLQLGDGRHIWVNFDGLLFLTTSNLIPTIFNPGPLVLDGKGSASGFIDLSKLGTLGIRIHVVLAVIDATAPLGIGFITEPYTMKV